jgi:hypothetical protein
MTWTTLTRRPTVRPQPSIHQRVLFWTLLVWFGAITVPISQGLGSVTMPDGPFAPAAHARVVPGGSVMGTAYPLSRSGV